MSEACSIGASFLYRIKEVYGDTSWMYEDGDDGFGDVRSACLQAGDTQVLRHLRGFFCIEVICHLLYTHKTAVAYQSVLSLPNVEEALEERSWLSLTRLRTKLEEAAFDISSLEAELESMERLRTSHMLVHKLSLPRMVEAIHHCRESIVWLRRSLKNPRSIAKIGDLTLSALFRLDVSFSGAMRICNNMLDITEGNALRGWQVQKKSRKEFQGYRSISEAMGSRGQE